MMTLGAVVLTGWWVDLSLLRTLAPGLPPMMPNAAACFLLLGGASWLLDGAAGTRRHAGVSMAGLTTLVALATLLEHATGLDPGLDRVLVARHTALGSGPDAGRMAGPLASGLLLVGGGVLLGAWPSRRKAAALLAGAGAALGLVTLTGYVLGVDDLLSAGGTNRIALHASVGLTLLGLATLFGCVPALAALPGSQLDGGRLARRFVPLAMCLPLLFALGRTLAVGAGVLPQETGFALAITLSALASVAIVAVGALWLDGVDAARVASAAELRRQALELEELYEHAPCGYFTVAPDGGVTRVNKTALRWLNRAREEVLMAPFSSLLLPAGREALAAASGDPVGPCPRRPGATGAEGACACQAELQVVSPGGALRVLASFARSPEPTHPGGCRVSLVDVTAARQAEEARLASQARAQRLVDANLIGVVVTRDDGQVLEANDELLRLAGLERGEVAAGLTRLELAARARSQPDPELPFEAELPRPGGGRVPVLVGFSRTTAGERIGFMLDLTAQRRAEAAVRELNATLERRVAERTTSLEAANAELEAFSYSVSHDLRAPLRAIDGFARILHDEHAQVLGPEARRLINVVRSNATRMGQLIDDLLALSRASRAALQACDVDMEGLVRVALDELPAARRGRVRIGCCLPPAIGDPSLLRLVWTNLLDNALKYSARATDPAVVVRAERGRAEVTYVVEDNGCGFDPAHAGRLFEPFQRLHGQEEYPGTGVGLALVARIVRRHGGRVSAEGEPGLGARFSFTLPFILPTEVPA